MNRPSRDELCLFCWVVDGEVNDRLVTLRAQLDWYRSDLRQELKKQYFPYADTHLGLIGLWRLETPIPFSEVDDLQPVDPEDDTSCPHIKRTKIEATVLLAEEYPCGIGKEEKGIHLIAKRRDFPSPSNSKQSDLAGRGSKHDKIEPHSKDQNQLSKTTVDPDAVAIGLMPRSATIAALYQKLTRYEFVHVHGTPGSGKTAMATLLHNHIRQVAPQTQVILLSHWYRTEIEPVGWRQYLSDRLDLDGTAYIIFDEGQSTYWDHSLWNDLFKSPRGRVAGAVVFASYGSPASSSLDIYTPLNLDRGQLVSLSHGLDNDGTGVVGLLFTRAEFDLYIHMRHKHHYFTTDFLEQLFERTNGHIGAIEKLLDVIKNHEDYRKCLHTGLSFSWASFNLNLDPYKLVKQIGTGGAFPRGLPDQKSLAEPALVEVFRLILCTDQYINLPLKALKQAQDHKLQGLVTCIEKGWIQSEHIWNEFGLVEEQVVYHFASPLHAWYIQMFHGSPLLTTPIPHLSLFQFCIEVVGRFSPNLATPRKVDSTTIQQPTEAQYQDEFYRCCQLVAPGNVIFSEFGARKGRVDFYLPLKQWGIELLHDGIDLQGHAGRFSAKGQYAGTVATEDYIILNFCRKMPRDAHPGLLKLYHVVFGDDCASVQIFNNQSELIFALPHV